MVHAVGFTWLMVAVAVPAAPTSNRPLQQAEKRISDAQFREGAKLLSQARAVRGNSHATLVRILVLTGEVAASLGDKPAAVAAFRELLVLEPLFPVDPDWSPKVQSPFYEAKGWADEHGAMEVAALPPQIKHGRIDGLRLRLVRDPLRLATAVRFHVSGQPPISSPFSLTTDRAQIDVVPAAEVHWWGEVVDEREAVLVSIGSQQAPRTASARSASSELAVAPASPTPKFVAPPDAVAATAPPPPAAESSPPLRPLAYGLGAGGLVGVGLGGFLGATSNSIDSRLQKAAKNPQGQVTGLTEKQAYSLNSQSATDATAANVLFGVGALAAAAGVGLWFYGAAADSPGAIEVSLAPSVAGLTLAGVVP